MRQVLILLVFITIFISSFSQNLSIIPKPFLVQQMSQQLKFSKESSFTYDKTNADLVWLADYSKKIIKPCLTSTKANGNSPLKVKFEINKENVPFLGTEGYQLSINETGVLISANNKAGLFYGVQTLYQLLSNDSLGGLSFVKISDQPRFSWRGMHLDVSRHFFPKAFILNYIDYLAMHKLNTFHWHLVDDQGWRIEIKKYPKLTSSGGYRVNHEDLAWNSRPLIKKGEKADFGGFYTQEDIKEIVAYAAKRNITIVPEIEMPAHAMSALAGYPFLSCTGENLGVAPGGVWPITHIYCAGNDSVFTFMEDVLKEVMALFPSTYIHVGGDEATKTNWEHCAKCQARMKTEGLKTVEELQSYFITRIGKFITDNNRKFIGWDEILEGGLAPSAAVMSWRGEQGGIAAAKEKHFVVMSPGSHCYFDHYQGSPIIEPLAIGGYTSLKKVYSFEPVPSELSIDESAYILGAQANLWTEFIPNGKQAEYMIFPRMAALSEVLWTNKDLKDWPDFSNRMKAQYSRYQKMGVNYSKSAYQPKLNTVVDATVDALIVQISSDVDNADIRFTANGQKTSLESEKFINPIILNSSATVYASIFENGIKMSEDILLNFNKHKAFGSISELKTEYGKQYTAGGQFAICDGLKGSTSLTDGRWQGYSGNDMVAIMDLKKVQSISCVTLTALQSNSSWIFMPKDVVFEVSTDGVTYFEVLRVKSQIPPSEITPTIQAYVCKEKRENIRYIRVTAHNMGNCPAGHIGEGKPSWLFVDEIVVE